MGVAGGGMSVRCRCTKVGRLCVRRGFSAGGCAASFACRDLYGRRRCGLRMPRLAAFAVVVYCLGISTQTCF